MNLSAITKQLGYPTDCNSKVSVLPGGWDEIMNDSSGTMREPRHRNRPSLALIMLSLARAVVGPAEPLSVRNHAVIPGPARKFWAEPARNLPLSHVVPLGSRLPLNQDLGIPLSSPCLTNHCARVETSRPLPLNREPTKWVWVELRKQATRRRKRDNFLSNGRPVLPRHGRSLGSSSLTSASWCAAGTTP